MARDRRRRAITLLWDTRFSLVTVVLAGFGRAAAEVGAVMIVGGNIDGVTRVMTTAIALETSKGDLPLALGLGIILLTLVLLLNAALLGEGSRAAALRLDDRRQNRVVAMTSPDPMRSGDARGRRMLPLVLDSVSFAVGGKTIIDRVSHARSPPGRARSSSAPTGRARAC